MATVYVPTPIRRLTNGQSKITVDGTDVAGLIQAVDAEYPGVADRILDGEGNLKRFINVFVNDDEIRTLQGLQTPVSEKDKISIVPAMAGGARSYTRAQTLRPCSAQNTMAEIRRLYH